MGTTNKPAVTAVASAEDAGKFDFGAVLEPDSAIAWPQALGEPLGLTSRLSDQLSVLGNLKVFVGMGTQSSLRPQQGDSVSILGLNAAGSNRALAAAGVLDVIPSHVSRVPDLLRRGLIAVDVALVRARLVPGTDYLTTGVVSDYTQALVGAARIVIVELDDRLPLTAQDALLPIDSIDRFVIADQPEVLMYDGAPTSVELAVAAHVAERVPNRATIQIGIGSLSVAVAQALTNHNGLGVHSGSMSDALVDLIESGAVTNANKGIDHGISVTGCLLGSDRLIRFADGNSALQMRSAEYTHNGRVLSSLASFYSINSAVEVDLTGQVNSEVAGNRYLGAVGGQVDFVRGSMWSEGGRSIIALPSTTPDGKRSRIVASLDGRPVTTPRSDVDMIITEYGAADLRGCSLVERARRLTTIAHPDHRDRLRFEVSGQNLAGISKGSTYG